MTHTVKTAPGAAPRPEEHYDLHQFQRKRPVVSKESCITFQDAAGMIVRNPAVSTEPVPLWTNDDAKIKLIVTRSLWGMWHMSQLTFPTDIYELDPLAFALNLEEQLRKRCIDLWKKHRNETQIKGIAGGKRAKKYGYALLLSTIIFQRYRMGKNSAEISGELKELVSPCAVRQIISRCNAIARVVLPAEDTLPLGKKSGAAAVRDLEYKRAIFLSGQRTKNGPNHGRRLPTATEIYRLFQAGRTREDLSREYECCPAVIGGKIRKGREYANGGCPRPAHLGIPQILQLFKEGLTVDEIVETSKRTKEFVECVLRENGLLLQTSDTRRPR